MLCINKYLCKNFAFTNEYIFYVDRKLEIQIFFSTYLTVLNATNELETSIYPYTYKNKYKLFKITRNGLSNIYTCL